MIKIVTALGNPNLNFELRKYSEFEIIGKDIQYTDGIVEILDFYNEIDYFIVSGILEGQISILELIDKIHEKNNKSKIIIALGEKDDDVEEQLYKKGIYDFIYDKSNILDVINLLKSKNIELINKQLRDEIKNLRAIINDKNEINIIKKNNEKSKKKSIKNNKKISKKNKKIKLKKYNKINKKKDNKIFAITRK